MKRNLLIGCGNDHGKKIFFDNEPAWGGELLKMDMNPNCNADLAWNMEDRPLPFDNEYFDEVHAYNCLEHWGALGDWRAWFEEMAEYWRILKPGGLFCCLVPIGMDAFADPGHTRFFHKNHFFFLNQDFYTQNEVKQTCFSDYRWYWKLNFEILVMEEIADHHIGTMLRKS